MRQLSLVGTLLVSLWSIVLISSPASASTAAADIGQPLSAAAQARAARAKPARLPAVQSPADAGAEAAALPLYALSPAKDGVWMYQGSSWQNIGGPAAAIYACAGALVATSPQTGDVYLYGGGGSWTKVGGPGQDFVIDDTGYLYGLSAAGVFVWVGGESWVQIGGPASSIRAGGGRLIATSPQTGDVYLYGGGGGWTRIGGPGQDFAVDSVGNVYGLSAVGVFQWTGGESWAQIGGPAAAIYAGGGTVVATNPQTGDVFRYLGGGGWTRAGGPGSTFSISNDSFLYGLSAVGVFQWTGGENWAQIGGPAATIAS